MAVHPMGFVSRRFVVFSPPLHTWATRWGGHPTHRLRFRLLCERSNALLLLLLRSISPSTAVLLSSYRATCFPLVDKYSVLLVRSPPVSPIISFFSHHRLNLEWSVFLSPFLFDVFPGFSPVRASVTTSCTILRKEGPSSWWPRTSRLAVSTSRTSRWSSTSTSPRRWR